LFKEKVRIMTLKEDIISDKKVDISEPVKSKSIKSYSNREIDIINAAYFTTYKYNEDK
jgi:hypothetical protein